MKIKLLCIASLLISINSFSQIAKDILIGANVDLIKSDNGGGYFKKIQSSAELNYFITRKFTATGGLEYWSGGHPSSFVLGGRYYPAPEAFVRVRGLIGANDVSIGGGWAKPLHNDWRFEAIADVYTKGYVAIRAGFAYLIKQ